MLCRHRSIAPTMAPGAERRNVVVLRELIPLEVSLAVESKIGALAPQVSSLSLLRRVFVVGHSWMAIPVLKGRENFDTFWKQMKVYVKLNGFESVFDNDPYVEVGADGNDRESIMAQGVSTSMYERQLMARVFLSQA